MPATSCPVVRGMRLTRITRNQTVPHNRQERTAPNAGTGGDIFDVLSDSQPLAVWNGHPFPISPGTYAPKVLYRKHKSDKMTLSG